MLGFFLPIGGPNAISPPVYYIAPDGKLMASPVAAQAGTIEPGTPVALFQTRIAGAGATGGTRPQYDVAPDGRFLINGNSDAATTSPITLLMNWQPPAK